MTRRILTIIFLFTSLTLNAKEIYLTDYGAKSWSFENASHAIANALNDAMGEKDIVLSFPGGRIDLWPEGAAKKELYISNTTEDDTLSKVKNLGICLEEYSNITIEGNNTLVVLHGKMISFALLNCCNVTIKNINFDYERPTMSELTLVDVSDSLIKAVIHPDSKYSLKDGKLDFYGEGWKSRRHHTILFDPGANQTKYSSWEPFQKSVAKEVAFREIEFSGDFSKQEFRAGSILTIRDPYRDNCGAFISQSKNIRLENVKMHYMHGLGLVSQFSENITFNKVEVTPRKESGRVMAAFADCFHFSGCKGVVQLDSCRTSGSHDDPMNVHGTHLKITRKVGNKLFVRFMHHQTYGFKAFFAGDSVAFVKPENLLIYGFGVLKDAKLISKREMALEFEEALPGNFKVGDCLENVTWTPKVIVRNCRFERTNTRGLLVTTRRPVLIENNTFYKTGMHALMIANDCNFWFESGPVSDVTIKGNRFLGCGYNQKDSGYVIAIQPETHNFEAGRFIHSNIRIENNVFECIGNPLLFARSVKNFRFVNNDIRNTQPAGISEKPISRISLEHCRGVAIEDNRFEGFLQQKLDINYMKRSEIKIDPPNLFQ